MAGVADLLEVGDHLSQPLVFGFLLQHLRVSDHGVHGCTQLMAHIRQEQLALRHVGGIGCRPGVLDGLVVVGVSDGADYKGHVSADDLDCFFVQVEIAARIGEREHALHFAILA